MFRTLRSSSLSFDQRLSSVLNNCIIPHSTDKVNLGAVVVADRVSVQDGDYVGEKLF